MLTAPTTIRLNKNAAPAPYNKDSLFLCKFIFLISYLYIGHIRT